MDIVNGKVIFIGAGPGAPDLMTIRGMKALQHADVVLYDALVSEDLLANTPSGCKHVYVGKRKGKKEFCQDEINSLLVFYGARYKNVVRLKGGDPYVFGRGHEELSFVARHGIDTEMIPGLSSAIGAPSAAGIPITKRGVTESFWVITGTLSSGQISNDIYHASRSSATMVILMGLSHLHEIASMVSELRSRDEAIAVIQHGSLPEQKVVVGTASNITAAVSEAQIGSPAVIVIGKVVHERRKLIDIIERTVSAEHFK